MDKPGPSGQNNQKPSKQASATQIVCEEETEEETSPPVLRLRLQPAKPDNRVKWAEDTVDNENMGKKKSKCCCIYKKPKVFGESDTSSDDSDADDCTAHCHGHKKKCYKHVKTKHTHRHRDDDSDTDEDTAG